MGAWRDDDYYTSARAFMRRMARTPEDQDNPWKRAGAILILLLIVVAIIRSL
jgi:hypothetical protein